MNTLNLKNIIETNGLDKTEIATELFPSNSYPMIALSRVIKGESQLNAEQISRLSLLTGIPISNLFDGAKWKSVVQAPSTCIVFESESYRAELNMETMTSKIYDKDSLIHDSIVSDRFLPMSEYLQNIDNLILKYKQCQKSK